MHVQAVPGCTARAASHSNFNLLRAGGQNLIMFRGLGTSFPGIPCKRSGSSLGQYSRAVVKKGRIMACLRRVLAESGWRRFSFTLALVAVTNLVTGTLIYSQYSSVNRLQTRPLRYTHPQNCSQTYQLVRPDYPYIAQDLHSHYSSHLTPIYIITPTHTRDTQKVDLTSLCHTFSHVPKLVWIVIEDSMERTKLVSDVLHRCMVDNVHLNFATSDKYKSSLPWPFYRMWGTIRGVEQRNIGLKWLREHRNKRNVSGVVYFADDDNKFDLRVFPEIRRTKKVSVFKVGFVGGLLYEGPRCDEKGRVAEWHSASAEWSPFTTQRKIPIDMAGFALNLRLLLAHPDVWIGVDRYGRDSKVGQLETDLLEHFTTRDDVECRGSNSEVYVWHTKTEQPNLKHEWHYPSDTSEVEFR